MANEIDLEGIVNKANDDNGLNKKLSAFDGEDGAPAPTAEELRKKSKEDMAKAIAQRLSFEHGDDGEESPEPAPKPENGKRKSSAAEADVPKKNKPVRVEEDDEYYEKPRKSKNQRNEEVRKKSSAVPVVIGFFVGLVIIAALAFYIGGLVMTSGKFLPGTTVNGHDVSMKTASQVAEMLKKENPQPSGVVFQNVDGTSVEIPFSAIGYKLDVLENVQKTLDKKNTAMWFVSLFKPESYKVNATKGEYDENKLKREISYIDWGNTEPQDAYIKDTSEGYVIVPEVVGKTVDSQTLFEYAKEQLDSGNVFNIQVERAAAEVKPSVKKEDLQSEVDKLNEMDKILSNVTITIDFDYAQEVLTGDDFGGWLTFAEDGASYTVDRTKVEGYVQALADKYDTYNKPRKFKATLQGEITVPISDDAKYGWWIYKDKTVDLIIKLIEEGKSVTTDPIYYYTENADGTKGYEFTGREEARTAGDDIGNTYVEIDLTAQTLWHYVDGKKVYECGIVSGQLNPAVRKTLPGVYKVWYKARNYTMSSSNAAGESWNTKCDYWTRVAIVGIGLHDSKWRGNNVGGQIYKTNGSHGCINMTLRDAKYIYENVEYGTPVVMYY